MWDRNLKMRENVTERPELEYIKSPSKFLDIIKSDCKTWWENSHYELRLSVAGRDFVVEQQPTKIERKSRTKSAAMVKEKVNCRWVDNPNQHKNLKDVIRTSFTKRKLHLIAKNKMQSCKCAWKKPHSVLKKVAQVICIALKQSDMAIKW